MKNIILSTTILRTFYNFDPKSNIHKDYTISDMKMILFMTQYRDSYSKLSFSYNFLQKQTGIKNISDLNLTLKRWDWKKNPETRLYEKQLTSNWRVNTTPKEKRIFKKYNTLFDKENVNRYATLLYDVKELLYKNTKELNLWKLTFYILYKTFTDPHTTIEIDLKNLYEILMIPNVKKQNKRYYENKIKLYIGLLYNANFIGPSNILNHKLIIYKNKYFNPNANKRDITTPEPKDPKPPTLPTTTSLPPTTYKSIFEDFNPNELDQTFLQYNGENDPNF